MSYNRKRNENSSDYELISTVEEFDSILYHMNEDSDLIEVNQAILDEKVSLNDILLEEISTKEFNGCNIFLFLYRLCDILVLLLVVIDVVIAIIAYAAALLNFSVSLYSVILMVYVFFVSSIISYTMAPIYNCLAGEWLNFVFSFAQVILASPLISFYIYYTINSVIALAEFFVDIPKHLKKLFSFFINFAKHYFIDFFTKFFDCDDEMSFDREEMKTIFAFSGLFLAIFVFFVGLTYVLFFIDKAIISLGMLYFVLNTFQIFAILSSSYVYFFQTLFNMKTRDLQYIWVFLEEANFFSDDDDDELDIKNIHKNDDMRSSKIIIDDSDISELDDLDSISNDCGDLISSIQKYIKVDNYLPLLHYSKMIAFDRHKQFRKKMCMILFLILNLVLISHDIYQIIQDYSDYLLSSIIIRFILVPLFSYYNICTVLFHKAKDKKLRIINYISIIFTFLVIVIIIFCIIYTEVYKSKYRINDLDYVPPFNNITRANSDMLIHPICEFNLFNSSAFDAFGYALGGYDLKRNKTIFENQMKIFFGENYSNHISYKLYEIDNNFLFLKYFDSISNSHIFAFRGYNSGPEIAFQFELFVSYYIIPFFEDNVPFYELINDYWLSFYTDFFNSFGLRFFENRNIITKYVKSIIEIYNKENFDDDDNVFFTGINCGGVIAKILGTLLHHKSISFISFPMDMNFLEHLFHFPSSYMSYVTNVFNIDGIFSHPDSDHAINIGIDMPIFYKSKFCSSGFCEIFSKTDNIYRTFCTMSEICGKGNQFNYYCKNTIGEKNLEIIRESLQESD